MKSKSVVLVGCYTTQAWNLIIKSPVMLVIPGDFPRPLMVLVNWINRNVTSL